MQIYKPVTEYYQTSTLLRSFYVHGLVIGLEVNFDIGKQYELYVPTFLLHVTFKI